ncbi:MAG TPA: hypothetical protein VJY62_03435 [Bacteroidia bacterium]|nr:hypothetical protein [Bacteroidia bacterium]
MVILLIFFIHLTGFTYCEQVPLPFFGIKPLKGDTIPYLEILNKFDWNIKIISKNGTIKQFEKCKPDSTFENINEFDTAFLYTEFKIASWLVNNLYALEFDITGSVKIAIDQKNILETGVFSREKKSDRTNMRIHDLAEFTLEDTLVTILITYVPYPKIKSFNLDLTIGNSEWGRKEKKSEKIEVSENFALGFFYLAFGIVFIILFLFFKIRKENLFFSLFCFFASISFLCVAVKPSIIGNNLLQCSLVLAIEFLSAFFSKILLNKEKTKLPLLIILIISVISFLPLFLFVPNMPNSFPFWIKIIIFLLLIIYASASSLYYLFQGFGQKKWEAKAITY